MKDRFSYDPMTREEAEEKIRSFSSLNEPNWDSYDADPITNNMIEAALHWLACMPDRMLPWFIVPGPDGTIEFEWSDEGGRQIEIVIRPDGTLDNEWSLATYREGDKLVFFKEDYK